jgi:membrane-associated phospholipid phosphatase
MTYREIECALACCFLLTADTACTNGFARPQEIPVSGSFPTLATRSEDKHPMKDADGQATENSNSLGAPFLKNLVSDQVAVWKSPAHIRWADGIWLFPLAAVTGGFFATDRAVPHALSTDPKKLNHYSTFSNYGVYSLVGAGGGLYLWSKVSHDDHQSETGVLAGEAAINSFAVETGFKYAFGRERPNEGQGLGKFFEGGVSFPSDHSAAAWSIASVIAHEYPGPLTQVAVYGLATAVSASRVLGKQHFPSDVVVGGAIGWLIGRQVYRAHHDPGLGGGGANSLSGNEEGEEHRDRHTMGSTFVPLDSWVYAAFERLAALRYVSTGMMGLKPWTRIECARLTEEAGEASPRAQADSEEAAGLAARLEQEFTYEINLLGGGRNFTAKLDSVYARAVSISGPPLTNSYHFGQTVAYDFGRPFERGTSGQAGGSFRAAAGPLAIYIRAEYQHAPAAPALSDALRNVIASSDQVPLSKVSAGPTGEINRAALLDAYITANLGNWQLVLGNQSLSWAPGPDSMMWSDNITPVHMVRLVNPESFHLPGPLRYVGPVRVDQFFGRLEGHPYVPRPYVYGQKISVKPFPWLELGFARRSMLGGGGDNSLTLSHLLHNFVGVQPVVNGVRLSVPGDSESEMDWTFYVPKVRNYIVLYGDAYAEDDVLPIENPPRNVWHPGVYLTRVPGIPKLDFHVQGVSTEQDGAVGGNNFGLFNYYNVNYHDGNTNSGNLIGNTVGRDGRAIRCWFTYWLSPQDTLQITYRHNSVNAQFIPQGGAWQDYGLRNEIQLRDGFYVKGELQLEHISRYPVLFKGPQMNVTAILEFGFSPDRRK